MNQLAIAPAITVIINVIKPLISNPKRLPVIAVLLGAISGIFTNPDIIEGVLTGIITGAGSVGLHEMTKLGQPSESDDINESIHDFTSLPDVG